MAGLKTYSSFLSRNCSTKPVALFRIIFGVLMAWHCWKYRTETLLYIRFIDPDFIFSYPLMDWLQYGVLPMKHFFLLYKIMFFSAICVALGFFYRSALLIFGLTFTYGFLLDKTYYNNHYYLISLLSLLMLFIPANGRWSLDAWFNFTPRRKSMPNWQLVLLQVQICLVYFFGGITKLDPDWMNMSVVSTTFAAYPSWGIFLITFGGLFMDFGLAFFLLHPKYKKYAIPAAVLFHCTIKFFINIGVFPFLMLGTLILFASWKGDADEKQQPIKPRTFAWMHLYLILQLLIPFHHFLYPGNVSWTKEGERFAWRMFSQEDAGHLDVFVTDAETKKSFKVPRLKGLSVLGYYRMTTDPSMIWQYVQYLEKAYKADGVKDPMIHVDSFVSLNGRNFARLIDREVDLAKEEYPFYRHASWILPHPDQQVGTEIAKNNVGAFFEPSYQLAVIDAEQIIPGDSPTHQWFAGEVDRLAERYGMKPQVIADRLVQERLRIWEQGGPLLTVRKMIEFNQGIQSPSFDYYLRQLERKYVLLR